MIDTWINNGSGWNVESIESQYINISCYTPLAGCPYMDLPVELKIPRKRLINIKNYGGKCFYRTMLGTLTLFRIWGGGGEAKRPLPSTRLSNVTSRNVGISPQNFLTFSFNPFDRLV